MYKKKNDIIDNTLIIKTPTDIKVVEQLESQLPLPASLDLGKRTYI